MATPPPTATFASTSAAPSAGFSIGVTRDGCAVSWASSVNRGNRFGQLGRGTSGSSHTDPTKPSEIKGLPRPIVAAFAGGYKDSGHAALVDATGALWMCGCDRWQQLGLGSSGAGAAGYTWKDGRIWQDTFQRCRALDGLLAGSTTSIRDVALGGDHTLVLAANRKDVFAFGRGQQGQLGLGAGAPFVSPPTRSAGLSSDTPVLAAVCAFRDCSMTLDDDGAVVSRAGKCPKNVFSDALEACQASARKRGLLGGTGGGGGAEVAEVEAG